MSSTITTKLSADNSDYKSVLADTERHTGKIIGQIGHHFTSARFLAHTIATAIGLNFEEIAKGLARMVTGVTEEEEASLKELVTLSDQLRERTIKDMHDAQTGQKLYNTLLMERVRLDKEYRDAQNDDTTKGTKDRIRLTLELKDKDREIVEFNKKAAEEEAKYNKELQDDVAEGLEHERKKKEEIGKATISGLEQAVDLDEKLSEQKTATLSIEDQLVQRQREKTELEMTQKTTVKGSTDDKELQVKLNEKNNEITKLGLEIAEKTAAAEAKLAASTKEAATANDDFVSSMGELFADAMKVIDAWTGFTGSIGSKGRGDNQLSDAELQRKIGNVRRDIFGREAANSTAAGGAYYNPSAPGTDILLEAQRASLQQALAEMRLREDVRRNAGAFGNNAAFQQYSGLTDQRFQDILRGGPGDATQQLVATLKELNTRLQKGIITVPMPDLNQDLLQTGNG